MLKHAVFVLLLTVAASVIIRLITRNLPITQTWLQDITIYKG